MSQCAPLATHAPYGWLKKARPAGVDQRQGGVTDPGGCESGEGARLQEHCHLLIVELPQGDQRYPSRVWSSHPSDQARDKISFIDTLYIILLPPHPPLLLSLSQQFNWAEPTPYSKGVHVMQALPISSSLPQPHWLAQIWHMTLADSIRTRPCIFNFLNINVCNR